MSANAGEVPVDSIRAGRNALADECIVLREVLDKNIFISKRHRARVMERVEAFEKHVVVLDKLLEGF